MKPPARSLFQLTASGAVLLAAASWSAASAADATTTATPAGKTAEEPYRPLLLASSKPADYWRGDYRGTLQLGLGYTSDNNYMFGQYNGLNDDQVTLIGQLQWQNFSDSSSQWRVSASDLGLDTREGEVRWGKTDKLSITLGFDSQLQVRNASGLTPFGGSDTHLRLPDNWQSGPTTSDFSLLDSTLQRLDRELQRDKLSLAISVRLNDNWRITSGLSYEEKQGTGDTGAAIYVDASSADAVLLAAPIDYRTTEFDLGLAYSGKQLHAQGSLDYSDFNNRDSQLVWQNPYSAYGPSGYPSGEGRLGLAPDNKQIRGRLSGQYILTTTARFQFDGSYAVANQDQDYLDYTVNPALSVSTPPPRDSYDGEVHIATFKGGLLLRPLPKLSIEAFYRVRERDYDAPRDGYRYIRGDGASQPRQSLTVYNSSHDYLSQTTGLEAHWRLPLRSKLTVEYALETIERENAAVEETEEDRFTVAYRIQPWPNFTTRVEVGYGNRRAAPYHWDQSYYALLDTALINATPDEQRYINHPQMSQFHLSNRDQLQAKMDFTLLPSDRWSLNFNLLWRDDDYDATELGLTGSQQQRAHLSASYAAASDLSVSVYAGFDQFESEQRSRAFRGGNEKNAFEIYPPLPQASDPARNWDLQSTDDSFTLGANLRWQLADNLELEADYSFVDTDGDQDFTAYGASDLAPGDLPAVETRMHHFTANGKWQLRDGLSLQLDYQYYRYHSDNWALDNAAPDSIDKVLSFGASSPNEQLHYVGVSTIYRWK